MIGVLIKITISYIMEIRKQLILLGLILSGFVFAVSFATLYAQTHIIEGNACKCTLPIPVLIPTFASLGIFVGLIVYYILFPKAEEKHSEFFEKILDILDPNEREVIKMLISNKGEISQAKISSKFGKVKAFRILERLRKRGIIEKESYGRTNKIKLAEKFKELVK